MARSVLLPTLAACAAGALFGCGPSFQVVYEGDSRFEHCYAMDENPTVPMPEKSECWSDWLRHYTYGQTRDRVEFAIVRYRAISRVDALPTDDAIMGAAPGEGSKSGALAAPAPTSAFASPPKTMDEETKQGTPAPTATPAPAPALPPIGPPAVTQLPAFKPPGASCVDSCGLSWQSCRGSCSLPVCSACDRTYAKCARGCFKGP